MCLYIYRDIEWFGSHDNFILWFTCSWNHQELVHRSRVKLSRFNQTPTWILPSEWFFLLLSVYGRGGAQISMITKYWDSNWYFLWMPEGIFCTHASQQVKLNTRVFNLFILTLLQPRDTNLFLSRMRMSAL